MKGFLRVWQECDLKDVEKFLVVAGELSSECYACHKLGIDLKAHQCPECGVYFKYIGVRRKLTMPFLKKIKEESSHLVFIDFDDFKKSMGKSDARKLLDL